MTEATLITSTAPNDAGEGTTATEGQLAKGQTTTTAEGQPGDKPADTKPAEGEKPAADAEYAITAPEGVELDAGGTLGLLFLAGSLGDLFGRARAFSQGIGHMCLLGVKLQVGSK